MYVYVVFGVVDGFFTEFPDSTRESIDQYEMDAYEYCKSSSCPQSNSNSNSNDDDDDSLGFDEGNVLDVLFWIFLPILDLIVIVYFIKLWINKKRYVTSIDTEKLLLEEQGRSDDLDQSHQHRNIQESV